MVKCYNNNKKYGTWYDRYYEEKQETKYMSNLYDKNS